MAILHYLKGNKRPFCLPRIGHPAETQGGERVRARQMMQQGLASPLAFQQCAKQRAKLKSRAVVRSPGLMAEAELPLFLGLGPLQRGVLQQLIHTEFSFPGEQKDWYPAEAMRQAADDAHDFRYMIPATQAPKGGVSM